jgi:hypothetical protein
MALLKLKTKPTTPIVTAAITVRRREVPVLCQPVAAPEPPHVVKPKPKAVKKPPAPRKVKQPSPTPEELAAARHARSEHVQWLMIEIMRRWQTVFPETETDLRPLAVGISKEIHAILNQDGIACSRSRITQAVTLYLSPPHRAKAYLQRLAEGGSRYGLDGNPQGTVTVKERQQAMKRIIYGDV